MTRVLPAPADLSREQDVDRRVPGPQQRVGVVGVRELELPVADEKGVVVAGDIGGTKTALAAFRRKGDPRSPFAQAVFPSGHYPSLDAVVREFLSQISDPIARAVFGVSGPVVQGQAKITNLPWVLDAQDLSGKLRIPSVVLLNDLEALAHALPYLEDADLHTLNSGRAVTSGALAVIAPGTGLGEAFLTWNGTHYRVHPSEGGHADFAPSDALQVGLFQHLQQRLGHVSAEAVCSGRGLPHIYEYLRDAGYAEEPTWLTEQLAAADPGPIIVAAALDADGPCRLCLMTLEVFVSILGAEAGNLALKVLATGGVYLGGGLSPRILPVLASGAFMKAFRSKGRLSYLLESMPVHVITNARAGLLGAAYLGLAEGKI